MGLLTCKEGLVLHGSSRLQISPIIANYSASQMFSLSNTKCLLYSISCPFVQASLKLAATLQHLLKSFIQASDVRWALNYFFLIKVQDLLNVYQ